MIFSCSVQVLEMEKGGAGSELLQRQLTESREKVQDLERAHSTRQEVCITAICSVTFIFTLI